MDKKLDDFSAQEAVTAIVYSIGILFIKAFSWCKENFHRLAGILWFVIFGIIYGYTGISAIAAIGVIGSVCYSIGWTIWNRKKVF